MEDELKNYNHLYEFLPDDFHERAKKKERDVEHPVITTLKNNPDHLQTWDTRIEELKNTSSGGKILTRYSKQADSNTAFQSFVAEMNCYLQLKEVFEDLKPVDENNVPEGTKPTDFHSEKHNIDIEVTHIGKHEPESKLYSIIREWVESFDKSYEVSLIKKDNYNKFPSGHEEISSNAAEVEEVRRLIIEAEEPTTIETSAFRVEVEKSNREDSIFMGGSWESGQFIPADPTNSLEDRIVDKVGKDPVSDHLIIYLDIDEIFIADHSLRKILQGKITRFEPPIEPEVSDELNTESKELKEYLIENGIIPSETSPSAIPPDKEGIFNEIDESIVGVIADIPNSSLLVFPNIYSRDEKVNEILSMHY